MKNAATGAHSDLATLEMTHVPSEAVGELVDVAPDVRWLRMPMPYALNHVNLYLLRMEHGWLIVDTGPDTPEARAIWEELFSGPLRGEPLVGVLCTHFHVDHAGLAGYLAERWHIPLFMTYGEYFTLRGWPMDMQEVPWQHAEFYRRAGLPEELLPTTLLMFRFSQQFSPLPPAFHRLRNGFPLPIGAADWRVLTGQGHSPELAMLFSPERSVLISGDQLLPRISTNVSISAINPEDEPLSLWLASLESFAELPDDTLVLPAHGLPFRGMKRRVYDLKAEHDRRFNIVLDACAKDRLSAFELVQLMYTLPLFDFNLLLAIGECLSHIHYLVFRGRLKGMPDVDGVVRYSTVPEQ